MRHSLVAGLALAGLLAAPGATQMPDVPPFVRVDFALDSGPVANVADAEEVVIAFPVVYAPGESLRLWFDEVTLAGSVADGTASFLRITSMEDGHVQRLDPVSIEQWYLSSAYFNGNGVWVEVVAQPGTGSNRVVLRELEVGLGWSTPGEPDGEGDTQCGPVDDREPSSDPRVSRLMPVACTSWMIDDCGKCHLSAGHCAGFITTIQFDVPFSNANGSLVNPPPSKQYSIDQQSIQLNNVYGNDWVYFGTFPNSNTQLTAYEAQGAAFELVDPPAPAGATIRITGHGTDSTPNSTYNQVQQTSSGPMVGAGTALSYQTDTQGGNSGSPIIWEQTDQAIGVHTNGGCSTGGGGSNSGTPITVGALQLALENPLGVCLSGSISGPFTDLGGNLMNGGFLAPALTACGTLEPNTDLDITLDTAFGLNASATAVLFVGFAQLNAPFQGGTLVPTPDIIVFGIPIDTSQSAFAQLTLATTWPSGVPSGFELVLQYWVEVSFIFLQGTVASNGLLMTAP